MWVEILWCCDRDIRKLVTPFGECGLKYSHFLLCLLLPSVTPFGECGLKFLRVILSMFLLCHSLWGVWVEIQSFDIDIKLRNRHSLWGVWVEISFNVITRILFIVTPFGECGLK